MSGLYLTARIAGRRVALPAAVIESVVEIDAITPVPLAAAHVRGLSALRSRTLTIVDTLVALGLAPHPVPSGIAEAVVVVIEGHLYGLLVDRVDDVVTIAGAPQTIRARMASGWRRAAIGMLEHEGEGVVLLDPAALVAGGGGGVTRS